MDSRRDSAHIRATHALALFLRRRVFRRATILCSLKGGLKIMTIAAVLFFPLYARAAPFELWATKATETSLTIYGSSTGFVNGSRQYGLGSSLTGPFLVSKWEILLVVSVLDARDDIVSVSGSIVHQSPTGHDDGQSDTISILLTVMASNQVGGRVIRGQGPNTITHGPHTDLYTGFMEASVLSAGGYDTITAYDFVIAISHCSDVCADDPPLETPIELPVTTESIPEPASITTLGIGLAAMVLSRRERRRLRVGKRSGRLGVQEVT